MSIQRHISLMTDRRFWPIFWTQFLGACNDNIFKNGIVILVTFQGLSLGDVSSQNIVFMSGAIFILPFFLFSGMAGQVCERISKARISLFIKIWELLIMLIASYGFLVPSLTNLLICLFLMGMHSAFFGPVKYSILPELLKKEELLFANAYVQAGTFCAILLGTLLGGLSIGSNALGHSMIVYLINGAAILGLIFSACMKPLPAIAPQIPIHFNPLKSGWDVIQVVRRTPILMISIMGISWFWLLGAAVLSLIPLFTKEYLFGSKEVVTFFLGIFSVGVALGAFFCEAMAPKSGKKNYARLNMIGAIGITFFMGLLYFIPARADQTILDFIPFLQTAQAYWSIPTFLLLSIFFGVYTLPLYTLIQERGTEGERSQTIAANNILNAVGIVIASLGLMVLFKFGLSYSQIFLIFSGLNLMTSFGIMQALKKHE